MKIIDLQHVTPCSLALIYRRLRRTCCLHQQGRWRVGGTYVHLLPQMWKQQNSPICVICPDDEATGFSETSVHIYQITRGHTPKDDYFCRFIYFSMLVLVRPSLSHTSKLWNVWEHTSTPSILLCAGSVEDRVLKRIYVISFTLCALYSRGKST
jgi:predicted phosphoadenosine phosphosulfate sulfurtransferase